ncbi:MAG: 30S ribosome-binding factor RbfA [Myxococcota bacterium]|jgi:phosphoesterase RecJ-like protein|nr:30S ribosome-binding factor RbfA [Myxococcota bacterium]
MVKEDNRRVGRVGGLLRAELSQLLTRQVNNPSLGWVTITAVTPSPDLRHARVFWVASGGRDKRQISLAFEKAAPFLQREVGKALRLKHTPKLAFFEDKSIDNGTLVDSLLHEVETERKVVEKRKPEERLAQLVGEAKTVLVFTHRNPDGDAIGSLLGMTCILSRMGKKTTAYCPDGVPRILQYLPGASEVQDSLEPHVVFDLSIALDVAAPDLLPKGLPESQDRGPLVVIDHHGTYGDFGDVVVRRAAASAVGELLYDLCRELLWPLDASVAMCLYTSIVSDTGSFRYSSTTAHTHEVAAELVKLGAQPWTVATALFESFPVHRQKLLGMVLATLWVSDDGKVALLSATPEMLQQCGATKEDLDSMVNLGRSIDTVEVSALLRLEPSGEIKVSFRSKGKVDVASLAAKFGGGGHRNAAGLTLRDMTLDGAGTLIATACRELIAETDG